MVSVGDSAPDFTAPLANGDIEQYTLSEHLDQAPIVLAFFPAAFTGTCTNEMCTFRDRMANFNDLDATIFGASIDTPFTLNEFRDQHGLDFGLISDVNRELIKEYDVAMDFAALGVRDVAKRSVFVIDAEGEVTYTWESDDPTIEPDYEAIEDAVDAAA